jgi:hypothetical protein
LSYREENGQVILTMSREDYDELLIVFAAATHLSLTGPLGNLIYGSDQVVALLNRLNSGNPNYTPYQMEKKS